MTFDILQLPLRLLFQTTAQPRHIGRIVKQHRFRGQAITPGATGFLIIGFDIARNIKVDHEANVWFIDAHAERHRRHHNLQVIALKFFLHVGANIIFQPSMIGRRANSLALQARSGVFYFRPAVAVDNAGLTALFLHVAHQLIERFELLHQHVANIRTVKTADLNQRIVQPQQAHDILARGVVGCGGQRHKRQRREPLAQLTERGIFRAEIVAPLGDTVRFING